MAALTLAAACTDGSSSTSEDTGPATSGATAVPSQGVTDTEVAIGVAWIDAQEILDQFGVDIGVYPVEDLFQAMAEGANARGGVADRDLRVVTSTFLPTQSAETDRVCAELMQDEEVFVVPGRCSPTSPCASPSSTASPTSVRSGRHRRSRSVRRVGSSPSSSTSPATRSPPCRR